MPNPSLFTFRSSRHSVPIAPDALPFPSISFSPEIREKIDPSVILNYYRDVEVPAKPKLDGPIDLDKYTVTNTPSGIGDCVILTGLPKLAKQAGKKLRLYSHSPHFGALMRCTESYEQLDSTAFQVAAAELNRDFDLGNGHFIQRLQRACGFEPMRVPRGGLSIKSEARKEKWVALHFDPGFHAAWQRQHIHPKARELYSFNRGIIQDFISERLKSGWHFFEFGEGREFFRDVETCQNYSLESSLALMNQCGYFFGIISGPMHLAAALGLKVITVINFPDPTKIYLPTLKNIGQVESEWFYPTAVHLHQDGEGALVPKFSRENLERAFNGEVYPYFSEDYVDLLFEKL